MKTILSPEQHLLRSSIESSLETPAVLLVTSARARDGKSATAYDLAESLAEAGHRVVLVDVGSESPAAWALARRGTPNNVSLVRMPMAAGDPRSSRAAVANFVRDLRNSFDFAIVDGTTFLGSAAGLIAGAVDGVLLTVRIGRRQTEEDAVMVRSLAQSNTRILGVVAVAAERIASFESARAERFEPAADDVAASSAYVQVAGA